MPMSQEIINVVDGMIMQMFDHGILKSTVSIIEAIASP